MNPIEQTGIKNIAVYARVSTANQEEEGTIETQLVEVREFARKAALNIIREYCDDGWSGDTLVRPALDSLRQDARSKMWDTILIYDPDRLARRYSYQELVMDELKEAGIDIKFVTVTSPSNPEEKILHGVRGLFAEYERAKIKERFRLGKQRKIKEGHIMVSQPLYGYSYTPKKDKVHGFYEINPEEARVVKMMFDWIANKGMTIRGVIKKLQEKGIKPRKSKRGVWSASTLTTILRNEAFIGKAHWRSSIAVIPKNPLKKERYRKTQKSSRIARPRDEWMSVDVPRIIDDDTFNDVRTKLSLNKNTQIGARHPYLLTGRIFCVCLKRRVGSGPQRGRYKYYVCCEKVASFPLLKKCNEKGLNAIHADNLVWERLSGILGSSDLLKAQITHESKESEMNRKYFKDDATVIGEEIRKLNEQIDRYNRAYGEGVFSIEQLREYVDPIRNRLVSLESDLRAANNHLLDVGETNFPSDEAIDLFASNFKKISKNLNFEQKREIVLNAVEKIVGNQSRLEIACNLILNQHVGYRTNHRNGWDNTQKVENLGKRIPFHFTIELPPPDYRNRPGSLNRFRRDVPNKLTAFPK